MPHPNADGSSPGGDIHISAGAALLEFEAEPIPVIAGSPPSRAAIPSSPPVARGSVAVSERAMHAGAPSRTVISPLGAFVLGFVLATSMAWLVSMPSGASTAASSLSTIEPVLAASSAPFASATSSIVPSPGTVPPAEEEVTTPAQTPRPKVPAAVSSPVRAQTRSAAAQFRGALAVSSQPEDAEVLLNGTPVGRTPMVLDSVPAGSHVVSVRRDGYVSWSSSVRIVADQRTQISSNLDSLVNR